MQYISVPNKKPTYVQLKQLLNDDNNSHQTQQDFKHKPPLSNLMGLVGCGALLKLTSILYMLRLGQGPLYLGHSANLEFPTVSKNTKK